MKFGRYIKKKDSGTAEKRGGKNLKRNKEVRRDDKRSI